MKDRKGEFDQIISYGNFDQRLDKWLLEGERSDFILNIDNKIYKGIREESGDDLSLNDDYYPF